MQLFIDSAIPEEIATAYSWGIMSGVTTNPSLAAKAGIPYRDLVKQILRIIDKRSILNLEVISDELPEMVKEGKHLAKLDKRIVVKVPCTWSGLQACQILNASGICVNVTLVFSPAQALLAAKAGAYLVSPFVGRLDDVESGSGNEVVSQIMEIYRNYEFDTQVLYASVRDVDHVVSAALLGAHVATAPFNVLEKLVQHQLTDAGILKFKQDWEATPPAMKK